MAATMIILVCFFVLVGLGVWAVEEVMWRAE
jgi:hypothetical protein